MSQRKNQPMAKRKAKQAEILVAKTLESNKKTRKN